MAFEIPDDLDVPEEVEDQLEEIAYDEAERIVALSKKSNIWPIERHIADRLKRCYRELYILRGNKRTNTENA